MYNHKLYPVSQPILYIVCQIIIDNLRANMESMSKFSAGYNEDLANELQELLNNAIALPGEAARTLEHESIRLEMVDMLPATLKAWKRLKRYIAKAFGPDEATQRAQWNAAGWAHYEAAANRNWPSVIALMEAGKQFIAANSAALLANNNMPAGFAAAYNTTAGAFVVKNNLFITAKQTAQVGTDAKITADNNIYAPVIDVCLDGQVEFEGTIIEKQFSFSAVADLVQPAGAAAAAIEAVSATTGLPLSGVEVIIVGTDKDTVTNAAGEGEITQVAAGDAQLKFMCDGFADKFVPFTFKPGVRSRIRVELQPLVVEIPEAVAQPTPEPVNA